MEAVADPASFAGPKEQSKGHCANGVLADRLDQRIRIVGEYIDQLFGGPRPILARRPDQYASKRRDPVQRRRCGWRRFGVAVASVHQAGRLAQKGREGFAGHGIGEHGHELVDVEFSPRPSAHVARRYRVRADPTIGVMLVDLRSLLGDLGAPEGSGLFVEQQRADEGWVLGGALALTGRADRPPVAPPSQVAPRIAAIGDRLGIDAFRLLSTRAGYGGLTRRSPQSCGGATRLVATRDGWLALSLARPDDRELLPALFESDFDGAAQADPWITIEHLASTRAIAALVERGALLGLALASIGETALDWATDGVPAVEWSPSGVDRPQRDRPLVADLSSLWAGPVCAHLLGVSGFEVVKVESTGRPDGARQGPPGFFAALHAGHRQLRLDFADAVDLNALRRAVGAADVVIEASRPRALEQLGITAKPNQVWVSITGHGRSGPGRNRIAFGDDAAVAGGLVAYDEQGPCFLADAIADPLTGMTAALAARRAWATGQGGVLDVAMARVAAWFAR